MNLKIEILNYGDNTTFDSFLKRWELKKAAEDQNWKEFDKAQTKEKQMFERAGEICFDCLFNIFSFFDKFELLHNFSFVCKSFYKIVHHPLFWKKLKLTNKQARNCDDFMLYKILQQFQIEELDLSNVCKPISFMRSLNIKRPHLKKVIVNRKILINSDAKSQIQKNNKHIKVEFFSEYGDTTKWFWLQTTEGKKYYIEVPTFNMTFLESKMIVKQKIGYEVDEMRFIFAGRECCDDRTLSDLNMYNDCTLHFILRLKG